MAGRGERIELIFHGGAQEVGRSCVEVRVNGDRYVIDCGLKFHEGGIDYPAKMFEIRHLDGLFLSHGHLDHSGGLPFFEHYGLHCPIFCTQETHDMLRILLKDSWRVQHMRHMWEAFDKGDLAKTFQDIREISGAPHQYRSIKYAHYNAGHIPGSTCIKIEAEGVKLLYTGDYNTTQTRLMHAADPHSWGEVDVLITEATYGARDHAKREEEEAAFLAKVEQVIARGGTALVPVFAIGRAQEVLLMLAQREWNVPIYVDGMAKKITRAILRGNSNYISHRTMLKHIYQKSRRVNNPRQREQASTTQAIIVSTSGMLEGGPAMHYLGQIWDDPRSAVLLTGYQSPSTNGAHLAQTGECRIDGERRKVQCEVQHFDFSAHLGREEIQETIRAVKPKVLIFMHGAPEAIETLQEWATKETGCAVYAPTVGEQITIGAAGQVSRLQLYTKDDLYEFPEEHQHGLKCETSFDDFERK